MYSLCKVLCGALLFFSLFINTQADSGQGEKSLQFIDVAVTTYLGDGQSFVDGDEISFMLSLDTAAYIYLFYQDVENNIVQLVPNQQQDSNHYQPGLFIPVPDRQANFKFAVQAPFGEEKLWVFATDTRLDGFSGQELVNGLQRPDQTIQQIRHIIKQQSVTAYGESLLTITVTGK